MHFKAKEGNMVGVDVGFGLGFWHQMLWPTPIYIRNLHIDVVLSLTHSDS